LTDCDKTDINVISLLCNQPSVGSQMRRPLRDGKFAAWSMLPVMVIQVARSGGIMISRNISNKHRTCSSATSFTNLTSHPRMHAGLRGEKSGPNLMKRDTAMKFDV
jgi:hypothetical protein